MKFNLVMVSVWLAAFVPMLVLILAMFIDRRRRKYIEKSPQTEKLLSTAKKLILINFAMITAMHGTINFESDVLNGLIKVKKKFQTSRLILIDWKLGLMKKDRK